MSNIKTEAAIRKEPPECLDHRHGAREERVGREVRGGEEMPSADEEDPRRDAQNDGESPVDRLPEFEEQRDTIHPPHGWCRRRHF